MAQTPMYQLFEPHFLHGLLGVFMDFSELSACPFCGSKNLGPNEFTRKGEQLVCVACDDCGAKGPETDNNPENSFYFAGMLWNKRED